ncbi:hypothetical protein NDQ72_18660 [Halomonas sp. KG2]|nr:hypothetical protein [Halomonas sp. KG2]WKD28034.1 hypothetical protein NDQ72_18660 [Halomonas sp. KG2]
MAALRRVVPVPAGTAWPDGDRRYLRRAATVLAGQPAVIGPLALADGLDNRYDILSRDLRGLHVPTVRASARWLAGKLATVSEFTQETLYGCIASCPW